MSAKKLNQKLNDAQAKNGKILGSVIYWGLRDCRIGCDDLEQLFEKYNLDKKYLPPDRRPKTAATKAISNTFSKQGTDGFLARKIASKGARTFWGIVREARNKEKVSLAYKCDIKLKFDMANSILEIEGDPKSDPEAYARAEQAIAEYHALLHEYTGYDIQRMIIEAVKDMGGISLRKGGGNYFVAYTYHGVLCAIQNVVEEIGSSEVGILNLSAGDEQSIRSLRRDTDRSFVQQIQDLKDSLKAFQDADNVRKSAVAYRFEQLQTLKKNVEMYASILNMNVESLHEEYRVCEEMLSNLDELSKNPKKKRTYKKKAKVEPVSEPEEKEELQPEEQPAQEETTTKLSIGRRRRRR